MLDSWGTTMMGDKRHSVHVGATLQTRIIVNHELSCQKFKVRRCLQFLVLDFAGRGLVHDYSTYSTILLQPTQPPGPSLKSELDFRSKSPPTQETGGLPLRNGISAAELALISRCSQRASDAARQRLS